VRHTDEEDKTMIAWTDVDPQQFETYPLPTPLKGPDELDAVLESVASGKTVEITLVDDSVIRGRRLALGRRASGRTKRLITQVRGCALPSG